MKRTIRTTQAALMLAALTMSFLCLPEASLAESKDSGATASMGDKTSSDAAAKLDKKEYRNVKVSVENGIATLNGSVDYYEYKADAEKRVHGVKGITSVRNLIEVGGPNVSDQELQSKLVEKLQYDRVGFGNAFNAIGVKVENGVVTLGGHARTYMDKNSAFALVSTYPGVKDLVDDIEVDPPSIMDDQTRMAVARSIYGFATLNKYAIDPAKPIRISVQNGQVELYGMVDSQADKDTAFMRANLVPGVFSVKNYLQVAGQPNEAHK
jgi:osmotically-inducible protein OsmY